MLLDMETLYSDAQSITATAESANVVRLSKGNFSEVAFGTPIPLSVQVVEDFEGATSVNVAFETSANENFSDEKVLAQSGDIPAEKLKAGYTFPLNYVPKGNLGYTRLKYTVDGSASAGKITAGIVAAHDNSYQNM